MQSARMSYYGPASQDSARKTKISRRLSQYDYGQDREDKQSLLRRAGHFNRHNKRLRRTFRIVPWRDERQLQEVGNALLSVLEAQTNESPNQAMFPEEAFAIVSVWKSRTEGLPHAVESTAALAQVYWRDSQRRAQRSRNGVSVTELRLCYSAAIVRCINGFADILQQQRAMAASVSSLCGQLGIPSWVVDTRHEGSHNALPNLEVLRLSASTLLEFMRSEYWVPRCPEWNNDNHEAIDSTRTTVSCEDETPNMEKNNLHSKYRSPIDFLLEYTSCASDWNKARCARSSANDIEEKGDKTAGKRRKKASSTGPKKTTILPYDPLFGEVGTLDSSSDDDDNSDAANDNRNAEIKLDKPVVNSIWGTSVGTNTNRYILLDISTKKKKKKKKDKKKPKKSISNNIKKRKGEKSPNDCAKLFVQSVSSLQEGHAVAIQYLIWGGIGGIPMGQGVLIGGSEVAFPATSLGITKCWQLYSPLVHVICRTWPGFAANMITNLVDCVLSTENEAEQCIQKKDGCELAARKLYFLFAWIRLILSQRFVSALDQSFAVKNISSKNNNPLELPLAQLNHLECIGYPLNSLLDRCRRFCTKIKKSNGSDDDKNSVTFKTSRSIIRSLETVLGEKNTVNFGYPQTAPSPQDSHRNVSPSLSECVDKKEDGETPDDDAGISSGGMSLDEMEKILLLEDNNNHNEPETKTEQNTNGSGDVFNQSPTAVLETNAIDEAEPPARRPAWIRCERWDVCSIGALPGYPS